MNDRYSDAFKSIVPDAPSAEGWAAGARRRRRRRLQAVTGSAALALVMAVVIPLGLGFGGSDQQMVATPAPTPSSVDDTCTLDEEGRMTTTELPGDTLPDGPVAVWLCPGGGAPAEPLVGEKATQQVVDSFRELPTTADGGLRRVYYHAYVLVDYPGGERYVIEVDATSSPGVRWGARRQRTRYGAAQWYSQLAELWREQRNNTPQSPPIARQVGVCDGVTWNLGRGIDHYDEDGALCAGVITDSGAQFVEVAASPSLIAEVRTEAMESRTPWLPDGEGNLLNDWRGDSIILVDDYGDRLPLIPGPDGSWYWREGEDPWKWTPSRGLATRLDQAFDAGRPSPQPTSS